MGGGCSSWHRSLVRGFSSSTETYETSHVSPLTGVSAPKSRIGGSGTTASHWAIRWDLWCETLIAILHGSTVVSFFQMLWLLLACAVGTLLLRPFARACAPLRRLRSRVSVMVPATCVLPLGAIGRDLPILNWQVHKLPPARFPKHCRSFKVSRTGGALGRLLCTLVGFSTCPLQVWSAPIGLTDVKAAADLVQAIERIHGQAKATLTEEDILRASGCLSPSGVFQRIPAPSPGSRPPAKPGPPVLGVTVFAPHYVPTFFGLVVPEHASLQQVLQAVQVIGHLPSQELDVIVPVASQRFDCSLSLLAFPSALLQLHPPQIPVLFDLTRVGGHYFAGILPTQVTRQDVLDKVTRLIWHDVEEVVVRVNDSQLPASRGALALAPGSVLTVLLHDHVPRMLHAAEAILANPDGWGPLEHSPTPRRAMGEAIIDARDLSAFRSSLLVPMWYSHTPHKSLGLDPSVKVASTDVHLYLDLNGEQCHTVHAGPADTGPWLVDFRPLGLPMRVVYSREEPDTATVLAALPCHSCAVTDLHIRCVTPAANREVSLPIIVVRAASPTDLGPQVANSMPKTTPPEQACYNTLTGKDQATASDEAHPVEATCRLLECKVPSEATPSLQAAVASVTGTAQVGVLPAPFHRIGDFPPPLAQAEADEDIDDEAEQDTIEAICLIFVLDMAPEEVRVQFQPPCTVDTFLSLVADTCDAERYILFSQHIPANPQPSQWWIALLAVPDWAQEEPMFLLNLKDIDGRCFVTASPWSLTRAVILDLASLPADGTHEVFPFNAFRPMEPEDEIQLIPYGTVTVRFAGARRVIQGHGLDNMLFTGTMWDLDPPLPAPAIANHSLLVHGHGSGLVLPRSGDVHPDPSEIAEVCRIPVGALRVTDARIVTSDVLKNGYFCHRVFGVTFLEPNDLADGWDHTHVVFIDCRAIFQGWALETCQHGRLSHADVIDWLDTFSPANWQPQITGAPIDNGMLQVANGTVLTASYVPVTSSDEEASVLPEQDDSESSSTSSTSGDMPQGRDDASAAQGQAVDVDRQPLQSHARDPTRSASRSRSRERPATARALQLAVFAAASTGGSGAAVGGAPCEMQLGTDPIGWDVFASLTWVITVGLCLLCLLFLGCACIGFWQELIVLCRVRQQMCQHKYIAEPAGRNASEQRHLDDLRNFTNALGGEWLPQLPIFPHGHLPPQEELHGEGEADTTDQVLQTVSCAILKHDYTPEFVDVNVLLPATPEEVAHLVQPHREPRTRELFPDLMSVAPQPIVSTALFLASPAWRSQHCGVCLDTSAIDRRIYVAFAPYYACKHDLLRLADLPSFVETAVYVGDDEDELADDAFAHLQPGVLIRFFSTGSFVPPVQGLGQLLLFPALWGPQAAFPLPSFTGAYCLAYRGQGQLFIADYGAPTLYRQHIADAVGLSVARLQLFPAHPRPQNASINGVPCRTVVAVGERECAALDTERHQVLLDCRPIEEGWKAVFAHFGQLDLRAIASDLSECCPPGWRVSFSPNQGADGWVFTQPGQVLEVSFRPNIVTWAVGETQEQMQFTGEGQATSANSGAFDLTQSGDEDGSSQSNAPSLTASEADRAQTMPPPQALLHFLVLAPEYQGEPVSILAQQPFRVEDIVNEVAEAREANAGRRFPRLLPGNMQPFTVPLCILALPSWHQPSVPVLIVCQVPPLRVFAEVVPPVIYERDVLRLAGVPGDSGAIVFLSDIPWAFSGAARLHVAPGDLIRICPPDHPVAQPMPFEQALRGVGSQQENPTPPRPPGDFLWILSDQGPQHLQPPETPRLPLSTAVAALLNEVEGALTVVPATEPIRDHSHSGVPSRQVFLGVVRDNPEAVPFILDLRPILSGIQWTFAFNRKANVQAICEGHRRRCPPGFFVRLTEILLQVTSGIISGMSTLARC